MTKELSTEKIFGLVRPLYQHNYDQFGIPIMNKIKEDRLDFSKVQPLNVQNLSVKNNNSRKFVLGFSEDDKIARFWNNPLKYIPHFQSAYAVATPDYSLHPQMDVYHIFIKFIKIAGLGVFGKNMVLWLCPVSDGQQKNGTI